MIIIKGISFVLQQDAYKVNVFYHDLEDKRKYTISFDLKMPTTIGAVIGKVCAQLHIGKSNVGIAEGFIFRAPGKI